MDSKIAKAIKLKNQPIAVYRTDIKEDNALQFKEGVWGCVIAMLNAASKGKTAIFSQETTACMGGRAGLGLKAYDLGYIEYFYPQEQMMAEKENVIRKILNLQEILL